MIIQASKIVYYENEFLKIVFTRAYDDVIYRSHSLRDWFVIIG